MDMTRAGFNIQHQDHLVYPESWLSLLQDVVSVTSSSGSIYVIDGPAGAGKTVFSHLLANEVDASSRTGVIELAENIPTAATFESLLKHLSLPVKASQSIGQSIMTLRQYTMALAKQAQHKVLVIDNAHYLEDQALAALASIFQGLSSDAPSLALVLLAEPGLAHQLDALNLIDVEVRDAPLPSFTLVETEELLQADFAKMPEAYGLQQHAYQELPLSQELVEDIWHNTEGRPNEMLIAARLAAHDLRETRPVWWKNIPLIHILALVALLMTLLWVYWIHGVKQEDDADVVLPTEKPRLEIVDKAQNQILDNTVDKTPSVPAKAVSSIAVVASSVGSELPVEKGLSSASAQSTHVASAASLPITKGSSTAGAPTTHTPIKNSEVSPRAPKPQPARPASSPKTSVQLPVPAKRSRADLNGLSQYEQELMLMPARGYVLQVLASSSHATLKSFLEKQPNRHSLRIYRSIRSGKSWFVLVEGYYADKPSASAAIRNLPSVQLRSGPWPKSLNAVRLEITAFKQQP